MIGQVSLRVRAFGSRKFWRKLPASAAIRASPVSHIPRHTAQTSKCSPSLHLASHVPRRSQEIDRLLSSIVRRAPGQAPPPGSIPISGPGRGRGAPRGMPAGRGGGPAGVAAMRAAAAAKAAAGGRGNGAGPAAGGRGGPPPPGGDNRPKLRWNQTNEEVEIVIRVDPSESIGRECPHSCCCGVLFCVALVMFMFMFMFNMRRRCCSSACVVLPPPAPCV